MKKVVVAALVALIAMPAFAWGPREQGALAGIAGTLLFQHITRDGAQPAPPVYSAPPPVYAPAPVYRSRDVHPDYIHRPMYRAVDVYIPECNCVRTIMVPVN